MRKNILPLAVVIVVIVIIVLIINIVMSLIKNRSVYNDIPGLKEISYPTNIRGIIQPMWADFPDYITFIGNENTLQLFLYELDVKSGKTTKLLPDYSVMHYTWSYDKTKIAFWGRNLTTGFEGVSIYSKNENELVQMDNDLGIPYAWSPDKTNLAINGACENPRHGCSFFHNITTLEREILSFNNSTKTFTDISWSPDGSEIAFVFGDPFLDMKIYGLYKMNLQNHQIDKLVGVKEIGTRIAQPIWIQSGKWLVFRLEEPKSESQLAFVHHQKGECQVFPLGNLFAIDYFDVHENDENMYFILLDKNQEPYYLDFGEAIKPLDINQILMCPQADQ